MVDVLEDDLFGLSIEISAFCGGLYGAREAGESDLVSGSTEEGLVVAVEVVDVDGFGRFRGSWRVLSRLLSRVAVPGQAHFLFLRGLLRWHSGVCVAVRHVAAGRGDSRGRGVLLMGI